VGWIESDRVVDAVAPAVVNGSEVRDLVFEGEDVWLVTYGRGLGQLRRGQVVWLDLPDRVRDPHLSAGFRDPVGRAWLLGNRGLTVAKFTTFKQVLQGQRDLAPLVFQIGWAAGFPEGTWAVPNGVLNPEGVLYLPTIEGFVRVDTRGLLKENRPPVFEAFLEDGDGKLLTSPVLSLKQRDAGVRLGLSVANPDSWETQLHQIRLLPASPDWRALEEPSLLLERLPPGQQVVEVRTRGLLGPWVTPQQVATLRVPPRIWEHWFFPWAVGLSVLIAGAFGERFRRRLLERGRAELERERRARAASEERLARLRANLERMGRLAVVGEVSAALTHEVMQPLGALVNTLEALKLRREALSKEGAEEEVKMLEEAMEQVHRASAIVRRYRTFLRPEAKAPMGRIVVAEAIEEALALVQPRLEAHGISLNLDIQPNLPPVFGEPLALEQVIVNLMNNACDALAHWKGVRRVTITARRERNAIRLEVRDTGPGIRRDLLTKLFTPLASDKPEGLGMGLRIAFQNVREMGGEIRIETFGGGAGFVVLLPIETSGTPA
jgi:signal transduction histidine kinase